jgi:hypothetical protein
LLLIFALISVFILVTKKNIESAKFFLTASSFAYVCALVFLFEGIGTREINSNHFYFLVIITGSLYFFIDSNYIFKYTIVILSVVMFLLIQLQLATCQPYLFISDDINRFARHHNLILSYCLLAGITWLFIKDIKITRPRYTEAI